MTVNSSPVLEPLVVLSNLYTIEQPVGLQPENDVPFLRAAPLEDRGRRVPTVMQYRDLVVRWDERRYRLQHLAR